MKTKTCYLGNVTCICHFAALSTGRRVQSDYQAHFQPTCPNSGTRVAGGNLLVRVVQHAKFPKHGQHL
jgi:hypothetical protein